MYMKSLIAFFCVFWLSAGLLNSQQLVHNFGNNNTTTSSISFSPDGRIMLIGGYAKSYDLGIGALDFRTLKKDTETQADFAFHVEISPDGRNFILSKQNRLEIWDFQSRTISRAIRDNQLVETAVCISNDGRYIVYMKKNGDVVFVNASTFNVSHQQKLTGETPVSLTASPDGKKILTGTKQGSIIVLDINTREIKTVKVSQDAVLQTDIPSSCDYVAAALSDGRIWLATYPGLEPVRSWQGHVAGQTTISFHPSGKYLASGGKDRTVRIWNIPDCTKKDEWEAHRNAVCSVVFSPDGTSLATGSANDAFSRTDDTRLWSFTAAAATTADAEKMVSPSQPSNTAAVNAKPKSSEGKRLALVIGNGNYLNSVLSNPENDAREMKNVLTQFGFDVLEYENLNQGQMKMAMDDFGEKLKNYDAGLFFYAGHGIQSKGYNFLIPVDANLKSEEQVEYDCVQADRILALMEASGSKVNIIILDACRNNPFERSWTRSAGGKGLAFMNAPGGSLIAYATAPGSTASDGTGKNGLYTSAILESIKIPGINILQIFQNVRSIVSEKSGGRQIPWESTSLTGDFYF